MVPARVKKICLTVFVSAMSLGVGIPTPVKAQLKLQDLVQVEQNQFTSHSFVVMDQVTGEVLLEKKPMDKWVPASLTKLLTGLVVLDQRPDMNKVCTFKKQDEVGGTRLNVKAGSKYKLGDLMHASLISSANNATDALADCVMDRASFVLAMNEKAKQLGATNSVFFEPSGMSPKNSITALDYSKIARAAFSTYEIQNITQKKNYSFSSVSKPRKSHSLTSTNLILRQNSVEVVGGKTGYLDESLYNFTISAKFKDRYVLAVVLGNPSKSSSFKESKAVLDIVRMKFGI